MTDPLEFFRKKKSWSKYKDLILDYYLEPYLAKVATLRRPILVVDCFAGPGEFDDGEPGSPLIISKRLEPIQNRGVEVMAFYVEKDPTLFERLKSGTRDAKVPVRTRLGDFRKYVDEIVELAHSRTVFVYLDPIKPSDLLFSDMECVYRQLEHGRSVEVLINFMSTGFLRAVCGRKDRILTENALKTEHPFVLKWDAVAGGTYWHDILFAGYADVDCVERLAEGYCQRLRQRFKWVISYPIRDKYKNEFPKYHLTFGSRHSDAVELMNRAMVKARREFVGTQFVDGCLFPNQPNSEVVNPHEIESLVISTSLRIGKVTWRELRVAATIESPCKYTDSEFNKAIKLAIQGRKVGSTCAGRKVEDGASVWPLR
jgi:three-Cys-motif partner protein